MASAKERFSRTKLPKAGGIATGGFSVRVEVVFVSAAITWCSAAKKMPRHAAAISNLVMNRCIDGFRKGVNTPPLEKSTMRAGSRQLLAFDGEVPFAHVHKHDFDAWLG